MPENSQGLAVWPNYVTKYQYSSSMKPALRIEFWKVFRKIKDWKYKWHNTIGLKTANLDSNFVYKLIEKNENSQKTLLLEFRYIGTVWTIEIK